jgi:hypothetical protein
MLDLDRNFPYFYGCSQNLLRVNGKNLTTWDSCAIFSYKIKQKVYMDTQTRWSLKPELVHDKISEIFIYLLLQLDSEFDKFIQRSQLTKMSAQNLITCFWGHDPPTYCDSSHKEKNDRMVPQKKQYVTTSSPQILEDN